MMATNEIYGQLHTNRWIEHIKNFGAISDAVSEHEDGHHGNDYHCCHLIFRKKGMSR